MNPQEDFLAKSKYIAIYGLKRNNEGFSTGVVKALKEQDPSRQFIAVHPDCAQVGGIQTVRSAASIRQTPDSAFIILKEKDVETAIDDVVKGKIQNVWLVMFYKGDHHVQYAKNKGLHVVQGCPMLFMEDSGFPHSAHRWLAKLFKKI